jgi:hypothetical protein
VVISGGFAETNQNAGLLSPVLLDQNFVAWRVFGAGGTPSGVLIDEDGKVASSVVVGAEAVLALARDTRETLAA